jgi:uncharacterized membrane protein YheB (UPF0754 family)
MEFNVVRRPDDEGVDILTRMSREDLMGMMFDHHRGRFLDLLFNQLVEGMAEKMIDALYKDIVSAIDPKEAAKEIRDKVVNDISARIISAIRNEQGQNYSGPVSETAGKEILEALNESRDQTDPRSAP